MAQRSDDLAPAASVAASFATTHWSVVLNARGPDTPEAARALEILCRTYYHPLYAFVRRWGHGAEDAQDLTWVFFRRFLEADSLASVSRDKGTFRSFLLASLKHPPMMTRRKTMEAKPRSLLPPTRRPS